MSKSPAKAEQCQAVRKTGEPCRGKPLAGSQYCFAHSPNAQAWRAKGGHNRSNAARSLKAIPERLRPIADILCQAIEDVRDGRLKPQQASAMAALAGALVRVTTAGELEQRLQSLEATLSA